MPVFLPPLRTPMITLCISRLRLSHGTCISSRVIAIAGRGERNWKRLWSTGLYYVCSDRTVTQQTKALSCSIEVPDNRFKQLTAREKQSFGAAVLSLQKMKNLFYGQASRLIRCTINLTSKKGLESIDNQLRVLQGRSTRTSWSQTCISDHLFMQDRNFPSFARTFLHKGTRTWESRKFTSVKHQSSNFAMARQLHCHGNTQFFKQSGQHRKTDRCFETFRQLF